MPVPLKLPPNKSMTSESKNLAFLARRVSSLEKSLVILREVVEQIASNQAEFKPTIDAIFAGIEQNGKDHQKILKELEIIE